MRHADGNRVSAKRHSEMIGEDLTQFAWSPERPVPRHHHDLVTMFHFAVRCRVLCVIKLFQHIPDHDRKVRGDLLIVSRISSIVARLKPRAPFQRTVCWLTSSTQVAA